jgi:hypothetical protein
MKRIPRSPGSQGNWAGGRRRHPPSEVATNEDQELKSALNCEADGLGAGADFAFVPEPDPRIAENHKLCGRRVRTYYPLWT